MSAKRFPAVLLFSILGACAGISDAPGVAWPIAIPAGGDTDAKKRSQAVDALDQLRQSPRDEQAIIWYGRRLAYLGLYDDAIAVYSLGLTLHPDSPRLLRHRGHRFLSTRRFELALADFDRARRAITGTDDEVEPDGMPNARNIPTSTLHTNIWYHLGLVRYCRGEFAAAVGCYRQCLAAAKNPDMEAATRYWLFLASSRAGDAATAKAALEPVHADWDIIENHAYHQLLLLFRGDKKRGELRTPSGDAIQGKTMAYGLARHLAVTGREAAAHEALRAVATGGSPAFGCIAAESDLRRR